MVKKRMKKRVILLVIAAALAALAGLGVYRAIQARAEQQRAAALRSVVSTALTKRDIRTTIIGNGTLAEGSAVDLKMPKGVRIGQVFVENGDQVTRGQLLATVDYPSLRDAVTKVQAEIASIDQQLLDIEETNEEKELQAPVSGTVRQVFVTAGSDVSASMQEKGALVTMYAESGSREISISALEGEVTEVYVHAGEHVRQGERLLMLRTVKEEAARRQLLTNRETLETTLQNLYILSRTGEVTADRDGIVQNVFVQEDTVVTGQAAAAGIPSAAGSDEMAAYLAGIGMMAARTDEAGELRHAAWNGGESGSGGFTLLGAETGEAEDGPDPGEDGLDFSKEAILSAAALAEEELFEEVIPEEWEEAEELWPDDTDPAFAEHPQPDSTLPASPEDLSGEGAAEEDELLPEEAWEVVTEEDGFSAGERSEAYERVLSALESNTELQQLLQQLRENPALLQALQTAEQNPGLLQTLTALSENPELVRSLSALAGNSQLLQSLSALAENPDLLKALTPAGGTASLQSLLDALGQNPELQQLLQNAGRSAAWQQLLNRLGLTAGGEPLLPDEGAGSGSRLFDLLTQNLSEEGRNLLSLLGSGANLYSLLGSGVNLSSLLESSPELTTLMRQLSGLLGGETDLSGLLGGGGNLSSLSGASGLAALLGLGGDLSGLGGDLSALSGSGTDLFTLLGAGALLSGLSDSDAALSGLLASGLDLSTLLGGSLGGGAGATGTALSYAMVPAFSISEDANVSVTISVNEMDILSVKKGQTAEVVFDALSGRSFEGTVTDIASTGTNTGGTTKYEVKVGLLRDEDMRSDMSCTVTILVSEVPDAGSIPSAAVMTEQGKNFVYTQCSDDGTLGGKTEITTGVSDGEFVEILDGLTGEDTVYYRAKSVNLLDAMGSLYGETESAA